jgi:hypothetical protein
MEKTPSSSTNTKRSFYRRKLPYSPRIIEQSTSMLNYLKAQNNRKASPTIVSHQFEDMHIKQVERSLIINRSFFFFLLLLSINNI